MEKKRWIIVIGAILMQLCLGAIYAWSAFTKPLTAEPFNFTKTETQMVFSLGLLSFAFFMALIAGKWQAKAGPKKVALVGGLILGLGYILAGLSGTSFLGILMGIGLLGGAGIGLAYVCPIAVLVKWFPDKKGLITGLAVAGFGFGALIWIKLTSGFKFGPFDLTPGWNGLFGDGMSVGSVLILYGIIFAVVVAIGALFLKNPPDGWKPAGWEPKSVANCSGVGETNFTVKEMVRTPQYWNVFFCFAVGSVAGLMVIGIIALFGADALTANGIDPAKAIIITGTAMGLFYALMNGFGRIIWGGISDKIGRKNSIIAMSLLQGVMMFTLYYIGGSELGLYLAATIIGFNFGGNLVLYPAVTADYFGNKNIGTNYPWVFLAYGVGGIIGPLLGGAMGDAKAWTWAFVPAGIACIVAGVIAMGLKAPCRVASANTSPALGIQES